MERALYPPGKYNPFFPGDHRSLEPDRGFLATTGSFSVGQRSEERTARDGEGSSPSQLPHSLPGAKDIVQDDCHMRPDAARGQVSSDSHLGPQCPDRAWLV